MNTVSSTSTVVLNLMEHFHGLWCGVTYYHGVYCYWCRHDSHRSLTITTHYPIGNDLLITNSPGQKRALIIGGVLSNFTRTHVNQMCYLLRDELHWPTVLINSLTPNKPSTQNIFKALQWLTAGVSSEDTLYLYYCGTSRDGVECTITPTGDPSESLSILTALQSLLGYHLPTIVMVLDTSNVILDSLPYDGQTKTPIGVTEANPFICLTSDNQLQENVGKLTQSLVSLMHDRHLRLSMDQVLRELEFVRPHVFNAYIRKSDPQTKIDHIFFGID